MPSLGVCSPWKKPSVVLKLVPPNESDQPDPTQPKFGSWGPNPTQLNPNLDPGGPTRPKIGFKLGSFGFIKYIIGLYPNLNPFWGQPDRIGPVFWPWGPIRPDSTRILGPKLGSTRKKLVGFDHTTWNSTTPQLNSYYKLYPEMKASKCCICHQNSVVVLENFLELWTKTQKSESFPIVKWSSKISSFSKLLSIATRLTKEEKSGGTVDWPPKIYQLGWVILALWLVISSSWNFPSWAELSWKVSKLSRAELGT